MDLVPFLRSLVAIDSTSSRSNLPVLDRLEDAARALGFETRRATWVDENGVDKGNLVCRRGPDAPGGLALVGHTDCVPFDPEWNEALAGAERDGKVFGRGAADTKGFLAAAIVAAAHARPGKHPLALLFTADEEVGCLGAKRLLAEGRVHPRHAIVGEPTSLTPIRAHKGYCAVEVVIEGIEGHSAYPDVGASAIHGLGRLWVEIETLRTDAAAVTPEAAEIVRFLEAESGNRSTTVPFGTELPEVIGMGAEGCVFGPGDIKVAHRTGEHVAVAELEKAAAILARAIERFCA